MKLYTIYKCGDCPNLEITYQNKTGEVIEYKCSLIDDYYNKEISDLNIVYENCPLDDIREYFRPNGSPTGKWFGNNLTMYLQECQEWLKQEIDDIHDIYCQKCKWQGYKQYNNRIVNHCFKKGNSASYKCEYYEEI